VHGGAGVTPGEEHASRLAGAVWSAVSVSGGTGAAAPRHFPAAVDRAALAALPLPVPDQLPPGQFVAMPDGDSFERHTGGDSLRAAYEHRPRTRIYEDIGWGQESGWAWLAGQRLTRLAGTGPRVTVTVYQSNSGDEELTAHRDRWLGVIFQVSGAKLWEAGDGLLGRGSRQLVLMMPGDVLVVPKNCPHLVTTPDDPGWSVHLVFAVNRDLPPG
jgi:hypothetical protein